MSQFSITQFLREERSSDGQPLYWGNADEYGAPYRGAPALFRPADQLDALRVVGVPRCEFFDVTVPEQKQAYLDVLARCASGWYHLRHQVWFWNNTTQHYLEWIERYTQADPRYLHLAAMAPTSELQGTK